ARRLESLAGPVCQLARAGLCRRLGSLRLLRILVFHSVLHAGDARQVARELLPLSLQLFRAGAVLLDDVLRRALDEALVVEPPSDSLQLRIDARDLLLHARLLGSKVDQVRQGKVYLNLGFDVHSSPFWTRCVEAAEADLAGVGEVLEGALVTSEKRGILGKKH